VEYEVRESYPALGPSEAPVDAMARRGWRLVKWAASVSLAATGRPAGGGGANQRLPTHAWEGRWQGREGHEAVFTLRYTCPMEAAGMHST
jgi:hypothetical protein